ncbi:MAG: dihydrofolate reductase family protein, partial [Thermoguttaceae bacterium]
ADSIDEVHVFIAPTLVGGSEAASPVAGRGIDLLSAALRLESPSIEQLDGDLYVHGHVARGKVLGAVRE